MPPEVNLELVVALKQEVSNVSSDNNLDASRVDLVDEVSLVKDHHLNVWVRLLILTIDAKLVA